MTTIPAYAEEAQLAGLVAAALQDHHNSRKRKHDALDDVPTDPALIQDDFPEAQPQVPASAVIFREPTAKSKKYSRPLLGTVFQSLQLAPEVFLSLQNAAKEYMLDPEHPERQATVRHKHATGGADLAKVKLWTCVEDFLKLGWGEKFFGYLAGIDAADGSPRTMFWPDHGQDIVKNLIPLMRKMVSNERQRRYAVGQRKNKAKSPPRNHQLEGADGTSEAAHDDEAVEPATFATQADALPELPEAVLSDPIQPPDIPNLGRPQLPDLLPPIELLVNVVRRGTSMMKRLIPRFNLQSNDCSTISILQQEVKKRLDEVDMGEEGPDKDELDVEHCEVRVWLPDGLVAVNSDGDWIMALLSAETAEWMDEQMRVLTLV